MQGKILVPDLAERVSVQIGLRPRKTEQLLRQLFEVIAAGLEQENFVKLKGIGTFKLLNVSDRESVSVNTGERVLVSGHRRVSFTPDPALRDRVNRPFAHFENIMLEDSEAEDAEEHPLDPVAERAEQTFADSDDVAEEEIPVSPATDAPVLGIQEISSPEDVPSVDSEEVVTSVADDLQDAEDEPIGTDNVPPVHCGESGENAEEDMPRGVGAACMPPAAAPRAAHGEETSAEKRACPPDREDRAPSSAESVQGEESTAPSERVQAAARRNVWKWVSLTLLELLLLAATYLAGYFRLFCPCEWTWLGLENTLISPRGGEDPAPVARTPYQAPSGAKSPQTPGIVRPAPARGDTTATRGAPSGTTSERPAPAQPTNAENLTPPTKKPVQIQTTRRLSALPVRRAPRQPRPTHRVVGLLRTFTVERGQTVYSIARQIYGDKRFASYIISYNALSNPDNIQAGQVLRLPDLDPIIDNEGE